MMYLIFTFSAQDGTASSQLSHNVCTRVVSAGNTLLDLEMDTWQIDSYAGKMEFLVRKCAHMIEYFLLAIAVSFPLYVYGLHGILLMLLAGGICIGYACLDEYHQSMVMGRYATPRDVCVDAIGVFIGIIVVRIIGWTGRHTIFRDNSSARQTRELDQARREIDQLRREQARMQRELSRQERSSKHETDRRQAHRTEPKRDPRFDDPNFDPRFDDPNYDPRFDDPNYDPRFDDPNYDPRLDDPNFDPRYDDPNYDPRFDDPNYDPRYDDPNYDPRYNDPNFDPRFDGSYPSNDDYSDDLSDDMPFSGLLKHPRRRS